MGCFVGTQLKDILLIRESILASSLIYNKDFKQKYIYIIKILLYILTVCKLEREAHIVCHPYLNFLGRVQAMGLMCLCSIARTTNYI